MFSSSEKSLTDECERQRPHDSASHFLQEVDQEGAHKKKYPRLKLRTRNYKTATAISPPKSALNIIVPKS